MGKCYDLAVVGAGFAGLSCARAAAHRGLKTLVLDRKPQAGVRMHTTGIIVKELADEWDIPPRLTRKLYRVRLYSPSLRHVDLERPGYYFLATNLRALMQWWTLRARMIDVDVQFDCALNDAQYRGDAWNLGGNDCRSRFLVGADGARSTVARLCGLDANRRLLVGVEAEFENVRGVDADHLHVFLDSRLAPGYIAWVVPGVPYTQVGLAARQGRSLRFEDFLKRAGGLFDFSRARQVERRSGYIPVNGPLRRIGDRRSLLIGDAAGLVSPLTAGGIHTAVHYGRYAGVAICDYLMDGGRIPADALADRTPAYRYKKLLRMAYDLDCPNGVYNALIGSRLVRAAAQSVFFHHRGLLSWATWRDIARRLVSAG